MNHCSRRATMEEGMGVVSTLSEHRDGDRSSESPWIFVLPILWKWSGLRTITDDCAGGTGFLDRTIRPNRSSGSSLFVSTTSATTTIKTGYYLIIYMHNICAIEAKLLCDITFIVLVCCYFFGIGFVERIVAQEKQQNSIACTITSGQRSSGCNWSEVFDKE